MSEEKAGETLASSENKDSEKPDVPGRLVSVDALRGFDMFWIMGGKSLVTALAAFTSWGWLQWIVDNQMVHPDWHGFALWDLIFPLFLFIAGVSTPIAIANRLAKGESRARIRLHIIQRGFALVFLGFIYNGFLKFDWGDPEKWANFRFCSVLGRIGLAYMFAAIIVMHTQWRTRLYWIAGLLIGYWIALRFIPVPGFGAGDLAPGHTLTDWIDQHLVPGKLYKDVRDPEGLFAVIPAIATALIGGLAGEMLRNPSINCLRKTGILAGAGLVCLFAAQLWNLDFPINKNLWSSSFVLHCAGLSLLLLSVFYLVIDVWKIRWWTFFFVVIGSNSILIYLAPKFIDFYRFTHALLDGPASLAGSFGPVFIALGMILVKWSMLFLCYRKKIFLKV
ncbi:MAG: acyltransferase family protein [Limisphaerales bacterium]